MTETFELWDLQGKQPVYMIAGWRQWADAGSTSSGLPQYIVDRLQAKKIGIIHTEGFYLFQFPGTHDLIRPMVKFNQGYPEYLKTQRNDFYFVEVGNVGLVVFIGDEPHLDIERYVAGLLDATEKLGVKRIIGLGGVFGEVPYDKDRNVTGNYSLHHLKDEVKRFAVGLSDYQGGASIGSIVCRRCTDRGIEYIGMYAFAPLYDFSEVEHVETTIRIENDFTAWLGIMLRINHMLKINIDLVDLEEKSNNLIKLLDDKVDQLDKAVPQIGVRDYFRKLSETFTEVSFNPLDDVWDEKLRQILDKFNDDDEDKRKE